MGEMNDLEKWVLETAKDIDEQICAYAEEHPNESQLFFTAQKARVELINAIMEK